ncbi:urease accessory protein UreD [Streptantibioticus ferralitis]|uniref:Urease accessory protein UreD n=1 Tax=Streptantibioticus ferralitis TaxID=236510 RepID=A0ABT5YXC4_9ACTN|nr:urease accessory protein UreD [Streptantibioticus ferralitis]MDF2256210.1 urease accessory protein UreD [Streptantibioticus ferralitis]
MTAVVPTRATAPASGVRAAARIVAAPDGRGGTALPVLDGAGPLALRRTRAVAPGTAQVTVVGAMSAPLGGDHLSLDTRVRTGARLAVGSAAATVSLPGRCGRSATYDVRLTVDSDAELCWLPEPLIAAAGSDLAMTTRVDLAEGARLVLREELVLGRAGERPGRLVSRLTVRLDGRALLDQGLALGPGAPGWSGPAVLDRYRAVGQLLVVEPRFRDRPCQVAVLPSDPAEGEAMLTPLAGPAALVTALAEDALMVRRLLDAGRQAAAAAAG